jgi:tetratricopeptide (TPR) repeat protein
MSDIHQSSKPLQPKSYAAAISLFGTFDRTFEQRRDWDRKVEQAKSCLIETRFEDGIALTAECLRSARDFFPHPEPQIINCGILLGRLYYAARQYELANSSFQGALNLCGSGQADVYAKVSLLGFIAATHIETGNSQEAINTCKQRLVLLDEMSQDSTTRNSSSRELRVEILKTLSSLCLGAGDLGAAEAYSYDLAHLQDKGLERGKTLLLLAQIYRANSNPHFARDTAVHAQEELLSGGADHHEPLILATAYRLEARLLFERKLFEFAREKYEQAHSIFRTVLGPNNLRTVLCGCDMAVVDTHIESSITAATSLNTLISQAEALTQRGSSDPELRPYLVSSAAIEHKLGVVTLAALAEIEKLVPQGDVSLLSVSKQLNRPELQVAWNLIFDRFIGGLDKQNLLSFLTDVGQQHLDNALKRYLQVVSSLQNQFGTHNCLEVATIYEQMSVVHYALGNGTWGRRYEDRAAFLRSKHENRDGGNQG